MRKHNSNKTCRQINEKKTLLELFIKLTKISRKHLVLLQSKDMWKAVPVVTVIQWLHGEAPELL